MDNQAGMTLAIAEARKSYQEGGIPIGAVLVAAGGRVLGRGHNARVQGGNPILHGEIACLQDAGRLPASAYKGATLYTTLSPCDMCAGACLLFGIPRVVIGEDATFAGAAAHLRQRGVDVVVLDDPACREMLRDFIARNPGIWNEDIGVEDSEGT
ncbi:putative cytosine deaminase [Xylaria palmicola]|nr:putative cytosine deaminase [Xylaria palmicola]